MWPSACSPLSSDGQRPSPRPFPRISSPLLTLTMSILPPQTSLTDHPSGIGSEMRRMAPPSEVRVVWRALSRAAEHQSSQPIAIRARLQAARITLERLEDEVVVAAVVIPCSSQSIELSRETGTLGVHCWTANDARSTSPALRLAVDENGLVVLRTSILGRLDIAGGTHDLVSVTIKD